MDNKYLFRVYHFNDKGEMQSPFLSSHTGRFGQAEVAEGRQRDNNNEFDSLWHKGREYKKNYDHYGFSAIGKVDPRYSIFSSDNGDLDDPEVLDAVHNEITKYVPESAKGQTRFKDQYAEDEKDDWQFLTNRAYSPLERTQYLSEMNGGKDGGASMFTISPELFNFDSDNVWDNFVDDIDMYDTFHRLHPNMPDEGDRVVLATAPENKIISVDDLVKNGYTQQRDFPSEIVTSEITPVRVLSEYPKAAANYFSARNKGATGPEAFSDSFKIEPKKIVSDEQLKNIYKDMCFFVGSRNRRSNILKGLKEFGQ